MREIRPGDAQTLADALSELLESEAAPQLERHRAWERGRSALASAQENAGYNGWTNYETWAVALWIDNEEPSYRTTRAKARAFAGQGNKDRTAEGEFADWLKAYVEETQPEIEASVWSDLMGAAFEAVDWYEIASNYLAEVEVKEEDA